MARKKLVEPKVEQVASEVIPEVESNESKVEQVETKIDLDIIPEVKQYKQVPIFDIFGSIINYKLEEI